MRLLNLAPRWGKFFLIGREKDVLEVGFEPTPSYEDQKTTFISEKDYLLSLAPWTARPLWHFDYFDYFYLPKSRRNTASGRIRTYARRWNLISSQTHEAVRRNMFQQNPYPVIKSFQEFCRTRTREWKMSRKARYIHFFIHLTNQIDLFIPQIDRDDWWGKKPQRILCSGNMTQHKYQK